MKTRLFALLFLAIHPLLAQRAQLTRLTDLSQLGIHTLQFTADVPPGKVFVIELKRENDEGPNYLRRLYTRPLPDERAVKIDMPIMESQQFFDPAENNRVVIKTPFATFLHQSAGLEGQFGGQTFTFRVIETKKGKGYTTSYAFHCFLADISEIPESVSSIPPGSSVITAEEITKPPPSP